MSTTLDLSRRPAPLPGPRTLAGLSIPALKAEMESLGLDGKQAGMRAKQLRRWIHHFGARDFSVMTDIAKELRARLADTYTLARPEIADHQVSKDGTQKWLTRFAPGVEGESVYIPDVGKAGALCVSSQVGCTLNCTFCHTGTQALVRNLTAAEIVQQVLIARDALDEWPSADEDRLLTNIVFMGMGEPLYNLDNIAEAIDTISDGDGLAIGRRRITVSTAGVAPKIPELGARTNAMLAISLHATNDDLRNELVPINRKYNLAELFDAIRAYPGVGNSRRVTFEYVMLKGVNDTIAEAHDLVRLLKGVPAKINLIPFNPWPGSPYECSSWDTIEAFAEILNRSRISAKASIVNRSGYASPIRTPRGRDILAACGQLRSESVKRSAAEKRREALATAPQPDA
jgi:23S rRNA (adenine2503-C2)-methyltransferase